MPVTKPLPRIGIEEYLRGEETAEVRHEYIDGQVYAMVGATVGHNLLASRLGMLLGAHLSGSPCHLFQSDMKVRVDQIFYYPDLVATCAPVRPDDLYLDAPILIVEILSDSTEGRDRFEKRIAYQRLPSLAEYVLLAPRHLRIEVFRRTAEGWELHTHTGGEMLRLTSLDFEVPVDSVYAGVRALSAERAP